MRQDQPNDKEVCESLYDRAIEVVRTTGRASLTWLQRQLNIGYQEAARLIDQLEERGIIGPAREDGPREILISRS